MRHLIAVLLFAVLSASAADRPPNIVFILADDLGRGELGCYGQTKIKTPNIDKLAAEGMRFTQFYAGNNVCAPSRCCLLTGKHAGHAFIRDNKELKPDGQLPIPKDSITIAKLLKARGYATGACGKWGLGMPDNDGSALKQGFDVFFGYYCQRHAHNHYPTFLWRNDEKVQLEGNDGSATGKQYSQDLFEAEALKFIDANKDKPFFLYLPFIVPHLALQVPEDSLNEYKGQWDDPPYDGKKSYLPHPVPRAAYAAMVTRMDRSVGRIVAKLSELKLDANTLVIFSSDNGPVYERLGGTDSEFFNSAEKFRGFKGSMYDGGIRVPFIARWTGMIKAGTTSDLPAAFYDVLPTLCELAGAETPKGIDGVSLAPTLLGKDGQIVHEFIYWESPGYGGQQAVRMGNWKGVRQKLKQGAAATELYDLANDIGEARNCAADHAQIVSKIEKIMREQHVKSAEFPLKGLDE